MLIFRANRASLVPLLLFFASFSMFSGQNSSFKVNSCARPTLPLDISRAFAKFLL